MTGADPIALPDDIASLQAMVIAMREQIAHERTALEQQLATERADAQSLREHIEILKQQLATLRHGRFGRSCRAARRQHPAARADHRGPGDKRRRTACSCTSGTPGFDSSRPISAVFAGSTQ